MQHEGMAAGDVINLDVGSIMAHRPEVSVKLGETMEALSATSTIGRRLQELIRLRIAFHNQCRSCMALRYRDAVDDGLTEDLVCSLEQPHEATDLTDAERAALRFADLFATDHLRIDDAVYDDLRAHFKEDELVDIGLLCAVCVGVGRLAATWDVVDHVPDALRSEGRVSPWATAGAVTS